MFNAVGQHYNELLITFLISKKNRTIDSLKQRRIYLRVVEFFD